MDREEFEKELIGSDNIIYENFYFSTILDEIVTKVINGMNYNYWLDYNVIKPILVVACRGRILNDNGYPEEVIIKFSIEIRVVVKKEENGDKTYHLSSVKEKQLFI
ncbi:hypothetical protein CSB11_02400 [Candidatus Campbellbacteria bacterium]|nr:MAG: hypothetical protein CSB11_02400 [Candidatus Campbellbacteria bacterium]